MELPDPPEGWHLKSINEINEDQWSAYLWSPDEYVYGYGSTLRYALLDALRRIEQGDVYGRCSGFAKLTEDPKIRAGIEELLASLAPPPPPKMKRRF
jgi:hypothetical protein